MALSDSSASARFEFPRGELRGTQMTLYPSCLVHRGDSFLETFPLAALASVRVEFERDGRRIGWGAGLVVLAIALFVISGPLAALAGNAAKELANGSSGVASALLALFRLVEMLARVLPVASTLAALAGAALIAYGWLGCTRLSLTFAGGERVYRVNGRNTLLLDFSEAVSEKILLLKRG